jgi:hypothetical protein
MQLYRHVTANHVTLKEMPFFRELSMEAYLIENPDVLALDEDDLSIVSIEEAEFPLPGARKIRQTDGRIDLVALYGESTVGILELKLGRLEEVHLQQLEDYLNAIDDNRDILKRFIESSEPKLIGVLVGSSITSELRLKIEQGYMIREKIPIAALTLKRYKGVDNNVYVTTDTFFQNMSRTFDRTKYLFNGAVYGKGRLVLAVITKYVNDHEDITYADLTAIFPKTTRGSSGCFDTVEKAQQTLDEGGRKRHFLEPDEIIELKDSKIAVSTQWGIHGITKFLETARKLGIKISEAKE